MNIEYRGYTIQEDSGSGPGKIIAFPTEQGIDHDYDCDGEGWSYCGNCLWSDSIEGAKAEIDYHILTTAEYVVTNRANGKAESFNFISKAVKCAIELGSKADYQFNFNSI